MLRENARFGGAVKELTTSARDLMRVPYMFFLERLLLKQHLGVPCFEGTSFGMVLRGNQRETLGSLRNTHTHLSEQSFGNEFPGAGLGPERKAEGRCFGGLLGVLVLQFLFLALDMKFLKDVWYLRYQTLQWRFVGLMRQKLIHEGMAILDASGAFT